MYMVHTCSRMYHICMNLVQKRMYIFTATLHFSSGPIGRATPASLSSAQAPLLQSSLLPFIRIDSVGWTCTVSCNVYTLYIRVRTMYIHVHTLYMGSTYGMYIPLWYVLLCSCMNFSCVMYVQFINNAMVQDSAFLYRQCSYRDIHAKNGYARWGHVQCQVMYIHGTYVYVQCTDMYIRCT